MLNAMAAPLKDLEEQIRLWITKKNLALAGDVTSQSRSSCRTVSSAQLASI
jgi:hypothetical protein